MENSYKVIVYLTINLKNFYSYIGVHKTKNPNVYDGYIGCGITGPKSNKFLHPKTQFQKAVKEYGYDNFHRITLAIFDKYKDALALEAVLVNEDFIRRYDTYNVALGGGDIIDTSTPTYQYDLNGNFVEKYDSRKECAESCDISHLTQLSYAINHKTILHNYYFSNEKVDKLNLSEYTKPQAQHIYIYNKAGEYIGERDSIGEFAKEIGSCLSSVQHAIAYETTIKGWYISLEKVNKFIKKEKNIKRNRPVFQYDLNGQFIKKWDNCNSIKNELGNEFKRIRSYALNGEKYHNSYWTYEEGVIKVTKPITPRKVGKYDLNGNLVEIYETTKAVQKEYPNIHKVLKGIYKQTRGFIFKYIDN